MVADPADFLSSDHRIAPVLWREQCDCTFYIHDILNMDNSREKTTVVTIMVVFLLLYGIFSFRALWLVAFIIGLASLFSGYLTRWIHKGWFFLGGLLGKVMSRVVFGILFFVILLPVAYISKIFRKDIMMMKKNYPSYFVDRNMVYEPKDLEKPW